MSDSRNCEFSEWDAKSIGVPSVWRKERVYASKPAQTEEVKFTETGIQCVTSQPKSVQTDLEEAEIQVNTLSQPYPPSLYAFFAKVTDKMCRSLQENLDPFAVEVFKDCGEEENSRHKDPVKEFTLRSSSITSEKDLTGRCVTWNKKGTQIAVGYVHNNHDAWCSHRVPVSSWNLRRIQSSKENEPHSEIFLPSCTACMEFHPFYPSVLAVGLFSGSVAIVDFSVSSDALTQKEDDVGGGTHDSKRKFEGFERGDQMTKLGYFITRPEHTLPISSVHWMKLTLNQSAQLIIKNKAASQYCLVTGGKDGHICVWSCNTANTRIFLEKKFIVWADNITSDAPLRSKTRSYLKQLGVLGLGCCKDDPFACVLTTFGGFIFQANLDNNIEAYSAMDELDVKSALSDDTVLDPGLVFLAAIKGLPITIDCSPFHRNIFLVATMEGTVLIKNMLELSSDIFQCELDMGHTGTLSDAKWSGRPAMFAVAHEKVVEIFDLKVGHKVAVTIPHDETITSLSFSQNEIGTLAVCDTKGVVHVWNLPKTLSSQEPHELDVLIGGPTNPTRVITKQGHQDKVSPHNEEEESDQN